MTKEELGQLGWLNREIAAERKRLCELEAVLCGRGSAAGLPDLNGEELMLVREEIEASPEDDRCTYQQSRCRIQPAFAGSLIRWRTA